MAVIALALFVVFAVWVEIVAGLNRYLGRGRRESLAGPVPQNFRRTSREVS